MTSSQALVAHARNVVDAAGIEGRRRSAMGVTVVDGAAWEVIGGHVMCARWWAATPATVNAYIDAVDERIASGRTGAAVWVLERSVRPPPLAERARYAALVRRGDSNSAGGAFVVEGGDLMGAVVRSFVTGVIFVADVKQSMSIAATVEQAAAKIVGQLRAPPPHVVTGAVDAVDVAAIVAAHERLRQARPR